MSALKELLLERRERFNTAFALARRARPRLSAEGFSQHLTEVLDPLIEGIPSEQRRAALTELYDLSLELVGSEILGPKSRYPAVVLAWEIVLPALATRLGAEPRRLAAAISNAAYHLDTTPGADCERWLQQMASLAGECDNVEQLLSAGQVLAWRCGLAHYRKAALALCDTLPTEWQSRLLEVNANLWSQWLDDPWFDPEAERDFEVVRRVGAFRGFGGLFLRPPTLRYVGDEQFVVDDGEGSWLLCADRFGATFHRCDDLPAQRGRAGLQLKAESICCGERELKLDELKEVLSWAAGERTFAYTLKNSHEVTLVRCP